jgi:hypothetical protein
MDMAFYLGLAFVLCHFRECADTTIRMGIFMYHLIYAKIKQLITLYSACAYDWYEKSGITSSSMATTTVSS